MAYTVTTDLTRGEISPALIDRQDAEFYPSAARLMRNWLADTGGQIFTRPALNQISTQSKTQTVLSGSYDWTQRCIRPFLFGSVEYVVVFDWFKPSNSVIATNVIRTQVYNAAGAIILTDESFVTPFGALTLANYEPQDLSGVISTSIAGPAMFIASQYFPPRRIAVQSNGSVVLTTALVFYQQLFGTVTPTSGGNVWNGVNTLFLDQLVPGSVILFRGQTFVVGAVGSQTNFTTTLNFVGVSATDRAAVVDNSFFNAANDRPRLVQFYAGRLIYFTSQNMPTGMWASQTNQPFIIGAAGVEDDAPINVEYLTEGLDSFTFALAAGRLYLGSTNGEFAIGASEIGLTPATAGIDVIGTTGSVQTPAATTTDVFFFINSPRTQLMAGQFDDIRKAVVLQDLSFLSPHLLSPLVQHLAYRPATGDDRTARLFLVMKDGSLATCGVSLQNNVITWSSWQIESFTVNAVGASKTTAYVSVDDGSFLILSKLGAIGEESFLLDLAVSYPASPVITLVPEQQGRTVGAWSDTIGFLGYFVPDFQGKIFLLDPPVPFGTVVVGLPYAPVLQLLPAALTDEQGPRLNRKRRVVRTIVDVFNTALLYINGVQVIGNAATPAGIQVPVRSGVFMSRSLGWSRQDETEITVPAGFPAVLRSVTREVV